MYNSVFTYGWIGVTNCWFEIEKKNFQKNIYLIPPKKTGNQYIYLVYYIRFSEFVSSVSGRRKYGFLFIKDG